MDYLSIAGLTLPPLIGGTAWLWHLGTKVAILGIRLDAIGERLGRIESLLDTLARFNEQH